VDGEKVELEFVCRNNTNAQSFGCRDGVEKLTILEDQGRLGVNHFFFQKMGWLVDNQSSKRRKESIPTWGADFDSSSVRLDLEETAVPSFLTRTNVNVTVISKIQLGKSGWDAIGITYGPLPMGVCSLDIVMGSSSKNS